MSDSALSISSLSSSASAASWDLTLLISASVHDRSPSRTGKPAASDCAAAVIPASLGAELTMILVDKRHRRISGDRGDSQTGPAATRLICRLTACRRRQPRSVTGLVSYR